jgi:hypothetical protein
MNALKTIKFRVLYGNMKIFYCALIVSFGVYIGEIVNFIEIHKDPMGSFFFALWVVFGFGVVFLLPWAIATMLSTFVLSSEGVAEYKGYIWGLFRGKAHTPWSGFQSWDNSLFFLPGQREKIPQINLYYKGRGIIRVNKKTRRLFGDDKPLEWNAFSRHLTALLNEAKLPCKAPESEISNRNLVIYLSAGAGALILFLLMVYGVLAFIAQPVVFLGALFIVLVLSALSWMKSGKHR